MNKIVTITNVKGFKSRGDLSFRTSLLYPISSFKWYVGQSN